VMVDLGEVICSAISRYRRRGLAFLRDLNNVASA
jgi:hypothetical protein